MRSKRLIKEKFGHNDQKAAANINITTFMANLERMATEVQTAGGIPVHLHYQLFTPKQN